MSLPDASALAPYVLTSVCCCSQLPLILFNYSAYVCAVCTYVYACLHVGVHMYVSECMSLPRLMSGAFLGCFSPGYSGTQAVSLPQASRYWD